MEIYELLSRLASVSKGSYELDFEIASFLGIDASIAPNMTTSIDGAWALIEHVYPERSIGILPKYQNNMFAGVIGDIKGPIDLKYCVIALGETPPMALCAVAVKAKGDL